MVDYKYRLTEYSEATENEELKVMAINMSFELMREQPDKFNKNGLDLVKLLQVTMNDSKLSPISKYGVLTTFIRNCSAEERQSRLEEIIETFDNPDTCIPDGKRYLLLKAMRCGSIGELFDDKQIFEDVIDKRLRLLKQKRRNDLIGIPNDEIGDVNLSQGNDSGVGGDR